MELDRRHPHSLAIAVLTSVDDLLSNMLRMGPKASFFGDGQLSDMRSKVVEARGALSEVNGIGMDRPAFHVFRAKIQEKINNLQASHHEFASKYVETLHPDDLEKAKRFKAERELLMDMMVEINRAEWRPEGSPG